MIVSIQLYSKRELGARSQETRMLCMAFFYYAAYTGRPRRKEKSPLSLSQEGQKEKNLPAIPHIGKKRGYESTPSAYKGKNAHLLRQPMESYTKKQKYISRIWKEGKSHRTAIFPGRSDL